MGKIPVAVVRCPSYQPKIVRQALVELLEKLGGIKQLIGSRKKIFLKPNLFSPYPPERALTTHPVIIQETAKIFLQAGAEVSVGDSPAGGLGEIEKLWEITGLKEIARQIPVKLVNLEKSGAEKIPVPQGRIYQELYISKAVRDSDCLVNIPKLKTHGLTTLTGAVKNMLGVVPGLGKVDFHRQAPLPEDFAKGIADLHQVIQPQLTIVDAVEVTEGEGPGPQGKKRQMGLLVAGVNPLAVDLVLAELAGLPEGWLLTTKELQKRAVPYGKINLSDIEILGERLEALKINDFLLPGGQFKVKLARFLPKWILQLLVSQINIRIGIDSLDCKRCLLCQKSCPVGAIKFVEGLPGQVDRKKCIECLSCYEVCSDQAIRVRRSFFARNWIGEIGKK
ncbi:MAG: DUF362 domain-containing protein [Elusimicrobiota bacterium]